MDIEQTLQKIAHWLSGYAPSLLEKLNPPASLAELEQVEQELGVTLPASVRKAYLVHNGEDGRSHIFDGFTWLSLDRVVALHHEQQEIEAEYGFGTFSIEMIPILDSSHGEFLYIESVSSPFAESPLFSYWHENPTREVKSASFAHFLSTFAHQLWVGDYVFDDPDFPDMLVNRYNAF